jgi:hypothetical protein
MYVFIDMWIWLDERCMYLLKIKENHESRAGEYRRGPHNLNKESPEE